MKREILYEAEPLKMPLVISLSVLGAGIITWESLGFVAGLVAAALLYYVFYSIHRKAYLETSKNPILLNFEGIHLDRITQDLGGEYLPWSEVGEIVEIFHSNTKRKYIQIKLAPGLYYENWRELSSVHRSTEPCYLIDANLYDAEHEDMLYSFKSYHEEFGPKDVNYPSVEADPNLGNPSTSRLSVGAFIGYAVVTYSLVSGGFPIGIRRAIYRESSPELFWLAVVSFFLIASWCAKEIYTRSSARQNSDAE